MDEINKSLAAIFKSAGVAYLPHFQTLWPIIHSYLQETEVFILLFALIAIADMIEYTGDNSAPFKEHFVQKMKECLTFPEPSIRQGTAYLLGICAQFAPNTYSDVCLGSLETLFQIVNMPEARSEDNVNSTENASCAIAKILSSYGPNIPNFEQYTANWLKTFPIIHDEECASFNYRMLAQLIEHNSPVVQGNVPEIVDHVIQALHQKSIASENAATIVESTKKLLGTLPQDQATTLLQRYLPEIMQTIQKWFA